MTKNNSFPYRNDKANRHRVCAVFALLTGLLFLSGCQSYTSQNSNMVTAWRAGDFEKAVSSAGEAAEKRADTRDSLLWRLEEGSIKRGAGLYAESNVAFQLAEEQVNDWEEKAKTQVSREAGAIITNLATLPYRGRAYDKIMMNAYQALNHLHLGELDQARVQLNRALQRQRDAVADNARRIEEAAEEARLAREGKLMDDDGQIVEPYDVELARQDASLSGALDTYMEDLDSGVAVYADYVNPFAVFLDALVYTFAPYDASDLERGRMSFSRLASMSPSRYSEEDMVLANHLAEGNTAPPLTYVIYETGFAPEREEIRIDIPLFLLSSNVSYVGASFPKLRFHKDSSLPLRVTVNNELHESEVLSSLESVIALDFKNEWPVILTKTLTSTATKALAAYTLEQSVSDQGFMAQLAVKAMVIAYQASMNRADLRSWMTLPRETRYCRFETPKDRLVEISVNGFTEVVGIEPGHISVIYIHGISPTTPPQIAQFTLVPERAVQLTLTQ